MSRIVESMNALRAERRALATRLRKLDRLISGFDSLNTVTVRHRRPRAKAVAKPVVKVKAAPKRRLGAIAKAVANRTATARSSQGASFATAAQA